MPERAWSSAGVGSHEGGGALALELEEPEEPSERARELPLPLAAAAGAMAEAARVSSGVQQHRRAAAEVCVGVRGAGGAARSTSGEGVQKSDLWHAAAAVTERRQARVECSHAPR
jgi:hypothetical protein